MKRSERIALVACGFAALTMGWATSGCKPEGKKPGPKAAAKTPAKKKAAPAVKPQPAAKAPKVPKEPPRPTKLSPPPPILPEFAGSHILIAYKGAMRAKPTIKHTKEQALALAKKLRAKAAKNPKNFPKLAKKHSDGPSGAKGGDLGVWKKGRMVKAFDAAISKLKVDEIAKEPVETRFGFHVMKRNALPELVSGSHIVIAYKGARRAKPTVSRSKEDAKKLADSIAKELAADPKKFEALCTKNSDGPNAKRGGPIGTWRKGRGMPVFEKALLSTAVGKTSKAVESPFGFHVFMRGPTPPEHGGSHILIAYKGASRARPWIKRSKEEAQKLAQKLCDEVRKDPKSFEMKALKFSDGPSARYGGTLGQWRKGQMVPAFDTAIAKLEVGAIVEKVIESPFGFHVIRRNKLVARPN